LCNNLDSVLRAYTPIIIASPHSTRFPMSKSQPSISLSANSQGLRIRDSQVSPESEEGMDVEASLQGENTSGTDVPSLPEDDNQEDINMDAGKSSEGKHSFGMDGSASPRSQHSFSINSLLLPEGMDDFGSIAPPSHLVQDHRTDHTPFELLYGYMPDFMIPVGHPLRIPVLDKCLQNLQVVRRDTEAALCLSKKQCSQTLNNV
jgi:hypothetical protein